MEGKGYVQVGETAFKDPATGEWTYGFPLFARVEDIGEGAEDGMVKSLGKAMAEMMREYVTGCGKAGIRV